MIWHETGNLVAHLVLPYRSESHVGHVTTNFTFTGVISSCHQPLWGVGERVVNRRFYGKAHPEGPAFYTVDPPLTATPIQ